MDVTLSTATVTSTTGGANILNVATVTTSLEGITNGDRIIVRIRRLGADTNDTLADIARLHKVVID